MMTGHVSSGHCLAVQLVVVHIHAHFHHQVWGVMGGGGVVMPLVRENNMVTS